MIMINDGVDDDKQVSNVSSISSFFRKYRDLWFMKVASWIYAFQKYKERHENISLSFSISIFSPYFQLHKNFHQLVVLSIWFSKPFSSNLFSYQAIVRQLACLRKF